MFTPNKRQAGQGVDCVARKFQILTALWDTLHDLDGVKDCTTGLTLGMIAKRVGMARSPHLHRLMDSLFLEGCVEATKIPYRPNVDQVVWEITEKARWSAAYCPLFDAWLGEDVADELEAV